MSLTQKLGPKPKVWGLSPAKKPGTRSERVGSEHSEEIEQKGSFFIGLQLLFGHGNPILQFRIVEGLTLYFNDYPL